MARRSSPASSSDLYLAAGYAAPYRELGLDDPELADARLAVERILTNHEPFPAVVMDRHWNLLQAKRAAQELFAAMLDLDRLPQPANVLELVFDPEGLRPHILDWDRAGTGTAGPRPPRGRGPRAGHRPRRSGHPARAGAGRSARAVGSQWPTD